VITLVSTDSDGSDNVYLTEVWSSIEAWQRATQSEEVAAWASSMPSLVSAPPETVLLELRGGKVTEPTLGDVLDAWRPGFRTDG
jgi:quinol monooxygenase YgiN